eukprot:scaffold6789_cov206-Skeletonema_marinoi.AAC.8
MDAAVITTNCIHAASNSNNPLLNLRLERSDRQSTVGMSRMSMPRPAVEYGRFDGRDRGMM